MNKYFLYARKSSESEERQAASVDSQIKELESTVIKNLNLKVEKPYFTESYSAKIPGRIEFNKMMTEVEQGGITAILCWKLNRLARNAIDGGRIIYAVTELKVQIITPSKTYSTDDLLLMYMEFGMANQFINDLSKDTRRGLRSKAEKGWLPSGAKPGYMNDRFAEKGSKTWLEDPIRYPLIKKCWDLMLTGAYNPVEILKRLNDEWGYRTPKHKRIGGKPFHRSAIYRMFADTFYYGEFEYPVNSGKWYQGKHKPMVTKEEFDKIQILLGRKESRRAKTHTFWGTGCMRCGACNAMITAEEKWQIICPDCKHKFASSNKTECPKCSVKITEMKKPTLLHYIYYHCTKRIDPNCTQKYIQSSDVDKQIDEMLSKIQISEKFKDWAIKHLNELNTEEVKHRNASLTSLNEAYGDVVRRIDNLVKLKISPQNTDGSLLSDSEFKSQKESLLREKEQLDGKQKGISGQIDKWLELSEKTFNFACYARYWFENGTPEKKREIFIGLGSNLKILNKIVRVDLEKPLEWITEAVSKTPEMTIKFEHEKITKDTAQMEYLYSQNPAMLRE